MRRLILAVAALSGLAAPAAAASMGPAQIGQIFCAGRLSQDMTEVLPLLSFDLGLLIAVLSAEGGLESIPWQSDTEPVGLCLPVGVRGTAEFPEAVLAYGFLSDRPGFTDTLVFRFIDGELYLDDIRYGGTGDTLRERLTP